MFKSILQTDDWPSIISCLMQKLIWCPVKMQTDQCPGLLQHFLHHKSLGKVFIAQGRITHKSIDQSGRILNSSEILSLS